jgi:predicted transcriptional regulator
MKTTYQGQNIITQLIKNCNEEYNIDKRMEILYHINSILAKQHQLKIPSLVTNAYIDTALFRIGETFC